MTRNFEHAVFILLPRNLDDQLVDGDAANRLRLAREVSKLADEVVEIAKQPQSRNFGSGSDGATSIVVVAAALLACIEARKLGDERVAIAMPHHAARNIGSDLADDSGSDIADDSGSDIACAIAGDVATDIPGDLAGTIAGDIAAAPRSDIAAATSRAHVVRGCVGAPHAPRANIGIAPLLERRRRHAARQADRAYRQLARPRRRGLRRRE
jgi:hypothetical protein